MHSSSQLERERHGRTDVFFNPPNLPKRDMRPLREKNLNKKAMDLRQTGGIIDIKGGKMQFGRYREGSTSPGRISQDKGDLEWSDKHAQTSLPSAGGSAELLDSGQPAALAAAEFNSTLRLAGRIRRLEQHQPDLDQLAEQRLRTSPGAARRLHSKTYERLNLDPLERQYGDLVPLQVEEAALIARVEARTQARVEALRPEPGRRPAGPELRDLLHLAVQHEFPVPPAPHALHVRPPPPRPVGYDRLARAATQRHRRLFSGRRC